MTLSSYLPGLNTVRFYAAWSVVFAHVFHATATPFFLSGWNAVTLFFTLSGYLITYRLLVEKKRRGHIDLKAFYIRRELRILPLYYLLVLVGGFILPLFGAPRASNEAMTAILLLVPQVPHALHLGTGLVSPLWSIGVEECFYLTFPFLMRHFSFVKLAWAVLLLSVFIQALASAVKAEYWYLAQTMRFECMAVGALAAYAVVNRSRWLRVVYHPIVHLAVIGALGCVVAFDLQLPLVHDLLLSSLVAVFLVNISTNPRSLFRLEYRWSKAAGDLTYGIYIWHYPVIWILAQAFSGSALAVASIIGTLVVASLSYRFIEKPILSLKDRFSPTLATAA